jgi:hypothetical protein
MTKQSLGSNRSPYLKCLVIASLLISALFVAQQVRAGASAAAGAAKVAQLVGAGADAYVGYILITSCQADHEPMTCAMAASTVASGVAMLAGAGQSGKSADAFKGNYTLPPGTDGTPVPYVDPTTKCAACDNSNVGNDGSGNTPNPGGPGGLNLTTTPTYAAIKHDLSALQNALTSSGITVSPDGKSVTLADGKKIPTSALKSDAGMAAAGASAGDIQALHATLAAATKEAEAKVKSMTAALQAAGGGGGSTGEPGGGASTASQANNNFGMYGAKTAPERKAASVSGMSKKLGNDNIGVSGDNLFEMVRRRYQSRDAENAFLKN